MQIKHSKEEEEEEEEGGGGRKEGNHHSYYIREEEGGHVMTGQLGPNGKLYKVNKSRGTWK